MTFDKASTLPDDNGRFGEFGGKFVPETLMAALTEWEVAYKDAKASQEFQARKIEETT